MKNSKEQKPGTSLMVIGLLIIAAAEIVGRFAQVPDILKGVLLGLGLGLEIMALIQMRKKPDA